MAASVVTATKPRKQPVQARSRVTVDAIFEATLQLLLTDGPRRLTTTRVAARAGVSVGTMYQYFPNKQALIYALNARYLESLADRIETVCREMEGQGAEAMVAALIDCYWRAKTERADVTRALYRSVAELDNSALIEAFANRVDKATEAMLATAPDLGGNDSRGLALTLLTVIFGTVRNTFERGLSPDDAARLQEELRVMCQAYLRARTG